jgi:DMSO reductase anchor subunit
MKPAWSVILLTTLIGAGQGLLLALFGVDVAARLAVIDAPSAAFFVTGCALSLALLLGGLAASFLHLGRPGRAWRAVAMWRTSWLSRECIVLPAFMAAVASYGAAHAFGWKCALWNGATAALLCVALFVCTAMVYMCLKFLQEWHTPLTLVNFLLLGSASGLLLAAALAGVLWPLLMPQLAVAAATATAAAAAARVVTLVRNARLRPASTLQSAIGIANPKIAQKAQGAMGGSFNTREFFHGRTLVAVRAAKWFFLLAAFVLPLALIAIALAQTAPRVLVLAFAVQYAGLLAERWFFLAQARHPQNIYYQAIS